MESDLRLVHYMGAILVLDSGFELSRATVNTKTGSVTRYSESIAAEPRSRSMSDLESREQVVGI